MIGLKWSSRASKSRRPYRAELPHADQTAIALRVRVDFLKDRADVVLAVLLATAPKARPHLEPRGILDLSHHLDLFWLSNGLFLCDRFQ
jgi:hypothetical protein